MIPGNFLTRQVIQRLPRSPGPATFRGVSSNADQAGTLTSSRKRVHAQQHPQQAHFHTISRDSITLLTTTCWPQSSQELPTFGHARFQRRYFDHRKKRKAAKKKNPFKVLGLPEGAILYKDAKKKFLTIAMKNHPDTIDGDVEEEEKERMRNKFIAARIAFESLAEDPMDGTAILASELEDAMENFDSWFKSETGFETPFQFDMDPEIMKEVATMTEKIGGGLDRDGGMWALARMVTSAVKSGSDAATVLRLESGDIKGKDRGMNGVLRRRRKR